MKNIFNVVVWIIVYGCKISSNQNLTTKTIGIGNLAMEISITDSFVVGGGVDSYVAYIITERRDTFHIELGSPNIIYKLFDLPPMGLSILGKEEYLKKYGKLPEKDEALFTDNPEEDNLQNIFQANYYLYDSINGIRVKLVQPKKIGEGKTGLYIPKLSGGKSLSIYAVNLDSSAHLKALKMFKSIRYK